MRDTPGPRPGDFLAACTVDPTVHALCPDYRALLMVADGLSSAPDAALADDLIARAEAHAHALLAGSAVEALPHIGAWRQGRRTSLTPDTSRALFILDALAPVADDGLAATADDLADALSLLGTPATVPRRRIAIR